MKKLFLNISDQMHSRLLTITEEQGYFNLSEATRAVITEGIKKISPGYIEIKKLQIKTRLSPDQKAELAALSTEARENQKFATSLEAKANICEILEGETMMINGLHHCQYTMYTESPGKQVDEVNMTEPFDLLTEQSISLQYRTLLGNTGPEAKSIIQKLL